MFLGYAMVVTFMVLIMTRRLSALVALILVPIVFGVLSGHGLQLGAMAVDGIGPSRRASGHGGILHGQLSL